MQRPLLLPLALLAALALPSKSRACWDGYHATTPHLSVIGDETDWSADRARELALWMPRIEALLAPRGLQLEGYRGTVTLPNGQMFFLPSGRMLEYGDLGELFGKLASGLGVRQAERQNALELRTEPLTVEAFRGRDEAEAYRRALLLNDALFGRGELDYGFYEAGEFPGENRRAHVVSALDGQGRRTYRVVVGAFLEANDAEALADVVRTIVGSASIRAL